MTGHERAARWYGGRAPEPAPYGADWRPGTSVLPADLLAAERCYGQNVTSPEIAPHAGGAPAFWWLDRNGDWAGLCGPCCARWRYHQTIIGGPGAVRITSRRPPGHVKLLGLDDEGGPTCAHCRAAWRVQPAGPRWHGFGNYWITEPMPPFPAGPPPAGGCDR